MRTAARLAGACGMRRAAPGTGGGRAGVTALRLQRRPICRLGLVAVVVAAAACTIVAAAPAELYVGGTQVHERDLDRWAEALHDAGLNTVSATVYAHQGDWDDDHLWYADEEPSVVAEIRAAKARGLRVVLILRVALDHAFPRNEFLWHGMIMPASEAALRSWFEQYARFALLWAGIAEREGVDVLGVGSELNELDETLPLSRWGNLKNYHGHAWYQRLSRRRALRFADRIEERHLGVSGRESYADLEQLLDARFRSQIAWGKQVHLRRGPHTLRRVNARRVLINERWVELIERVRAVYSGRLTFAANFDSYRAVGFWRQLDLIGINAYFPLRPNLEAPRTVEAFAASWRTILDRVRELRRAQGLGDRPLLLTEIGYTFRRHSTVEPWNHEGFAVVGWKRHAREFVVWGDEPVDREERARALAGLRRASRERPGELAGLLYWKLSTDAAHDAIEPFVIHVGPGSGDPALPVLAGFGVESSP